MAERAGFEPARSLRPLRDFQSRPFVHSGTSPTRRETPAQRTRKHLNRLTAGNPETSAIIGNGALGCPQAQSSILARHPSKMSVCSPIMFPDQYAGEYRIGVNTAMADPGFVKVAQVSEIRPGEMISVEVADEQVLLVNVDGNIHAVDDICSHAYATLSEGDLRGEEVECPLHGGSFNAITGVPINPPANEPLRVYQVQIEGDDVLVAPPAA